jgi:hypothetical protein
VERACERAGEGAGGGAGEGADPAVEPAVESAVARPDLALVLERHRVGLDAARPDAVERRRQRRRRTARENLADLVDDG